MTQLTLLARSYSQDVTDPVPISRRAALISAGAGMTGLSGCLGRLWSAWERESPAQIAVEILTLPPDEDLYALPIAHHLAENLERAGVQADVIPTRHVTFLREVLINHNFDMYVWKYGPQRDPDVLRPFLHGKFAEERGWQNPFGFSNSIVDNLLEDQLRSTDVERRTEYLAELQELLSNERPFIPIAFENERRLIREDRLDHFGSASFHDPVWLYGLRPVEASEDHISVSLGTTDGRVTHNMNPIAVEYRNHSGVLELVYESLAKSYRGNLVPWLADHWEWTSPTGGRIPTLELTLREGLSWHDGEPLTSEDVIFTHEFLQDTSMTDADPNIPSPRYRGRVSLLDSAEAVDSRTLLLQFSESTRTAARRLLTIPILPEHIWEEWTGITEVAGIPIDGVTTDALVEDNLDPIGSGPYRVTDVNADDLIRLELVEDHIFAAEDAHPLPTVSEPLVEEFIIDVRPSVTNIVESVSEGGLDGSIRGLGQELAREASEHPSIGEIAEETSKLYHIGFNVREGPALAHAGFRSAVEPLIDRLHVREEIFEGNARLTNTGVFEQGFVPASMQWNESDVNRFAGVPGTGEIDPEEARVAFRDAGFSFSADGELLVGQ